MDDPWEMKTPIDASTWLYEARLAHSLHNWDIKNVNIKSVTVTPALLRAKKCAEKMMLGPAFVTLCETLPVSESCKEEILIDEEDLAKERELSKDILFPPPIPDDELHTIAQSKDRMTKFRGALKECFSKDLLRVYVTNFADSVEHDAIHFTEDQVKGTPIALGNVCLHHKVRHLTLIQ